ncbi:hypothetical protein MSIMFB_05275 [Mycobacterium simulans]|uniref:Haemophore haem-binding domain-containing protein n=1 Tax=Mycobacterium simulans TaxID=627089 RepID=A0A7Z7ISN8_9MYCO|nr:hemophore-related protein [Mycobacterium simulans]SOJ57796.1 hypothetical protein MSIMFB_05275 [Mycobacterium simulans]
MKFSSKSAGFRVAGISAGCLLGGIAFGVLGTPSAAAAPDCSRLDAKTGQAVTAAYNQPAPPSFVTLRNYFLEHPHHYSDLTGMLALIGDNEGQCDSAVPPAQMGAMAA